MTTSGAVVFHERLNEMAPEVGLEPTTHRLTADCSTIELLWNSYQLIPTRPHPVIERPWKLNGSSIYKSWSARSTDVLPSAFRPRADSRRSGRGFLESALLSPARPPNSGIST